MTEMVPYLKMNGLGNDFVVLDARSNSIALTPDRVRWIADREQGIGCDQLIVMEPSVVDGVDLFMRIYNSEGGQVEACGNATRCIAALAGEELDRDSINIATVAGILRAKISGDIVSVDMGVPKLDWDQIPLAEEFADTRIIELQIGPIDAPVLHTPSVANIGNPHAVFWVNNDPGNYELERFGPMLENHPIFPERANISLAQVLDRTHIKVKVWERGVGLTLACGTAACAVAVSAVRKNLADRKVDIELPGGVLQLEWRECDSHILMSGPWSLDGRGALPEALFSEEFDS